MKQYNNKSSFSNILKSIIILIIGAVVGTIVSSIYGKSDYSSFQIVISLLFICIALMTYMVYDTLKNIIELKHSVGIKIT